MIYPFRSRLMRGFNKQDMPQQLESLFANYWNKELPDLLVALQMTTQFLEDLNGFLATAEDENKTSAESFKSIAGTCSRMVGSADPSWLKALYDLAPDLVGTALVGCMRIINRQTHDAGMLKAFKTLFDTLGIRIEGPWDKCVLTANFGSTSFHAGTLTVTS